MTIDHLARHIHRRGVLAAIAALILPAKAGAQFAQCAEAGEGCTLLVRCCSGDCVSLPTNPNAGICGGAIADGDDNDVPADGNFTCEEAAREYGLSGRPTCQSFTCQEDAQDFFDAYFPNDPCGLDGSEGPVTNGVPNVACEDRPICGFQRVRRSRQKARRLRRRRRIRRQRIWP